MSAYNLLETGLSVLLTVMGLSLFGIGAYGSLRFPPFHIHRAFAFKQRIQFTLFGILLLAIAATQFAGIAGGS